MNNSTLAEIAEAIRQARSILLFPHISMDGDALGSAAALCLALRSTGRDVWILIEDAVPENLRFLDRNCCTADQQIIADPDFCISIDCGESHRFPGRQEKFFDGKRTACIDHHITTKPFADLNFIDPKAAATAEIIRDLLQILSLQPDAAVAESLYTGIVTDTGRFQYSNTTPKTHRIAADLLERGFDLMQVTIELYQNVRREKILLHSRIMQTMEVFADGRAAVAWMTQAMLKETGALPEEADGIVEQLRNIRGVEVAGFIKEKEANAVKVSLRSKSSCDVSALAGRHGGGGHQRAAGYSAPLPVQPCLQALRAEITADLAEETEI